MTPEVRAAIAAVCIADQARSAVVSIYDHEAGAHVALEAQVSGGRVAGWDAARGSGFGGDLPDLWHQGAEAWFHLAAKGAGEYDGYDREAEASFAVRVAGAVAYVWDYGERSWRSYTARLLAGAF